MIPSRRKEALSQPLANGKFRRNAIHPGMRIPRLEADAEQLLVGARAIARVHHHALTREVHVVAAALQDETLAERMQLDVDVAALRSRVVASLTGEPAVGGFRDGEAPPPSPELVALLVRARGLSPWRTLTAADIVVAVGELSLVVASRWPVREPAVIDDAVGEAALIAGAAGAGETSPEHVASVLLDDPSIADAVARAGIDRGLLQGAWPAARRGDAPAPPSPSTRAVVARARALVTSRGSQGISTRACLLGEVAIAGHLDRALGEGGARAADLVAELFGRVRTNGPFVEVFFRDDDVTTQELVVLVLRDVFELPEETATWTMLEVHAGGARAIGPYPTADGRRRALAAMKRARERGMPLVVECRPCR